MPNSSESTANGAQPTGEPGVLKAFTSADPTIAKEPIMQEGDGWRAEVTEGRTIHLFEVPDPGVEECMLIYRAELKSEDFHPTPFMKQKWRLLVSALIILWAGSLFFTAIVKGEWMNWVWGIVVLICAASFCLLPAFRSKGGAYLEMWCRFPTEEFQPTSLMKQTLHLLGWALIILWAISMFFKGEFFTVIVKEGWMNCVWGIVVLIGAAALSRLSANRSKKGGEFFSKGFPHALTGTNDWASCETPFYLKRGQRTNLVKLDLALHGSGKVWIRNIQLLKSPLP